MFFLKNDGADYAVGVVIEIYLTALYIHPLELPQQGPGQSPGSFSTFYVSRG